jgi:hypothetical protein
MHKKGHHGGGIIGQSWKHIGVIVIIIAITAIIVVIIIIIIIVIIKIIIIIRIWENLEASGEHLGASGSIWMHLEESGRHLGGIWKHLGDIWRHLEVSGTHLESSGRYLGGIHFNMLLGLGSCPGAPWRPSWDGDSKNHKKITFTLGFPP